MSFSEYGNRFDLSLFFITYLIITFVTININGIRF